MTKKGYIFKSIWNIDAPAVAVWEALIDTRSWPEWWPYLEGVDLIWKGDLYGVGSLYRFVWKGSLPYTLSFQMVVEKIECPRLIEGVASGDIEGKGVWSLTAVSELSTRVEYRLNVHSNKTWMNIFAPVLGWFFKWNHNRVMEAGRIGLAARLREFDKPVFQE